MTPDQKFARWIKYSCVVFVLVFAYFLVADLAMPLTPQAMATRVVTKVAPRVNGQITHLYVANNQEIQKGDLLFQIDPQPYKLAVEKAQLNLQQVIQNNEQLDASITAAKADVEASKIVAEQKIREANRLNTLFSRNGTSQQQRDDAQSSATAAKANLLAAKARLKELEVSRGELGEANVNVRVAQNQLKQAELNLSYTQVSAEHDGVITNLQLETGAYAAAGTPLIALVAFDSLPGEVFEARITSLDAGVSSGQFDADGRLATPTDSNRWVRDAQRLRLHLSINEQPQAFPAGARATVQLLPDNMISGWLARLQIRFLSTLHYIY